MWLLDVNMPKDVVRALGDLGIVAHSAECRGWGGLTNGSLVEAASRAGFHAVLTRDRLFSQSAARSLKLFPSVRRCVSHNSSSSRPYVYRSIPSRVEAESDSTGAGKASSLASYQIYRLIWIFLCSGSRFPDAVYQS